MKYITEEQLKTNLGLGKTIEQWLSHQNEDDYTIINWLSIGKEKNGRYFVSYFQSFDDGNVDFTDIYEFSYLNPDEPSITNAFVSVAEALEFAILTYNASIEKFVNGGMIQVEYASYLSTK